MPRGVVITFLTIPPHASNLAARRGSKASSVKQLYIQVLGIQYDDSSSNPNGTTFTPSEEEAFLSLSRRPDIYNILTNSVAPSIQGDYTKDIKKAIVCQLMSGSAKKLPDGVRLRGDINLLLLGDPSTAKSQFLKFVEKVAPVGVYTSGKGSSAAGLTASVIKDARGEFYLEGGAMVLADGGIVCIDEFDKMRPADRVAIHEAMEQQTISIAKAGITTVLNTRASVLAAANPIFGRYDDLRTAGENIDLMTTILSRFDLIFIVRDIREEERDKAIARHVMGVHIGAVDKAEEEDQGDETVAEKAGRVRVIFFFLCRVLQEPLLFLHLRLLYTARCVICRPRRSPINLAHFKVANAGGKLDIETFKRFVMYCRTRCSPRLSPSSAAVLASSYVKIRDDVRRTSKEMGIDATQAVPITVRQLEALVRLSEAQAKMKLSKDVEPEDVREALRLFKVSTMAARETDSNGTDGGLLGAGARDEYLKAESFLQSHLAVGQLANKNKILEQAAGTGININILARVIKAMGRKGEILEKREGKQVYRVK